AHEHDYRQSAVIVNCVTELPPRRRAYERFTPEGPLAVLPLSGDRAAVIWTVAAERAPELAALPAEAFRARLEAAFGRRLGRIERVGERSVYPLVRVAADVPEVPRVVLAGN